MSDAAQNSLNRVYYLKMSGNSPIWYTTVDGITDQIKTLIDSGSSRNFIDVAFAQTHNIPLIELSKPRTVIAIDGEETTHPITHKVRLEILVEGRTFKQQFYVMHLGEDTNIILGMSWLKEANPHISWDTLTLSWKESISGKTADTPEDPGLPSEFSDFADVFSEELFKALPPHREGVVSYASHDLRPDFGPVPRTCLFLWLDSHSVFLVAYQPL